ncbi:MAG: hypothetical protein J6S63_04090 [Atopobiaceae bacterium]|nr:hypothetical protein [Atopobiaceae bacterium]
MKRKASKELAMLAAVMLVWAVVPTVFVAPALAEEDLAIELAEPAIEAENEEDILITTQADECPKGGEHTWEIKIQKATFNQSGTYYGVCTKCGIDGREIGAMVPLVPITEVKLSKTTYTYNGTAHKPTVMVYTPDGPMAPDQYKVTYSNNVNAGTKTAIAKLTMTSNWFEGTKRLKFTIKPAANTLAVTGKTATASYASVKKANVVVKRAKAMTVKKAQGTVTYKKKSGNKNFTINKKTGNVTVKKGTKKGTYKIKAQVTAAGNTNYNSISKVVTFKVTVA